MPAAKRNVGSEILEGLLSLKRGAPAAGDASAAWVPQSQLPPRSAVTCDAQ